MRASLRRGLTMLMVVSCLASTVTGCNRGTKVGGEGRLESDGRVLLGGPGRQPVTAGRSRPLKAGDTVEVAEGIAKVTLPAGAVLELQPGSVMFFSQGPELRSGDLLVTSDSSRGTVRAAGSQVEVSGAARVTLGPALRVAGYRGTAALRSGGRLLVVPALRSAEVQLIGLLPGRPSPLMLDRADPWVGRFLGEAVDKEADLESRSRGFTGQVRRADSESPAFFASLLPALSSEPDFGQEAVARLLRARPDVAGAGEVLVGSAIAIEGRRGTFAQRLAGAAGFRAEGASWSVVAVDQQVPSLDALLRLIDGAVNAAPLELAAPPPVQAPPLPPPPAPAGSTPASRRPAGRSSPTTPTTTRPPARRAPPPTQPPPAAPGLLDPLVESAVDPVVDLLNDLLGG